MRKINNPFKYSLQRRFSYSNSLSGYLILTSQDPGKNDPTRIKPGTNDPRKNDPTRIDPNTNDPRKNDPTRIAPGTNDPGKVDPTHIPGPVVPVPPSPSPAPETLQPSTK